MIKKISQRPPKGKYVLRESDTEVGKYTIVLQYCMNRKVAKTTFDNMTITEEQWNADKEIIVNHRDAARINYMLDTFRNDRDRNILDYFKKAQRIPIETLRYIVTFGHQPSEDADFIGICRSELQRQYDTDKIGFATYDNGQHYLNHLQRFMQEQKGINRIKVSELSLTLIDEYIQYQKQCNRKNQSINKTLTPIIKGIRKLFIDGLVAQSFYDEAKSRYLREEKRSLKAVNLNEEQDKYLTVEQYSKLIEYYNGCKGLRTKEYLEMFLFASATGLRASDIITLEWGHIDFEGKTLRKVLVKGHKEVCIPLSDEATNILKRWYKQDRKRRRKQFVFRLLPNRFDTDNQELLRKTLLSKDSSINRRLQHVGRELGFKRLTMHMARHSFATLALSEAPSPMTIKRISEILGHSSQYVTEARYIHRVADRNQMFNMLKLINDYDNNKLQREVS